MTVDFATRMRRYAWTTALSVLLMVGLRASGAPDQPGQQAQQSQPVTKPDLADPAAAAGKLTGSWAFNKEQSTGTFVANGEPGDTTGRPSGPPSGGGGSGFGGPMSLFGVRNLGHGGEKRESSATTEEQRAVQTLTTELRDVPKRLTIVAGAATATITPDDSDPRVFTIRNLKEKVDLILAKVDVTSRWDAGALVQEFDAGKSLQLSVTYAPSADGKQLSVKLVATRPKNQGGEDKPITRVYDRVQ